MTYPEIDIQGLEKIAQKYGFKNVLQFSDWVEDNGLGEILFGKDQEEIDSGKEDIDKDSMTYRSTILALEILSIPDVRDINHDDTTFDQWLELSRNIKNKRRKE